MSFKYEGSLGGGWYDACLVFEEWEAFRTTVFGGDEFY